VDAETLESAVDNACSVLPPASRPRRIRMVRRLETRGSKLARMPGRPAPA